ncbi:hypothetical protein X747_28815 [Mesorhizobium sp. LNJC384A00]|uniref:helix-turn-helix transcriptional regulator n=1 Tax=Mesorhizobium sp. LNJC384A00 TaxID=1287268 RepID=UPI0003CE4FF3|nr:helix-turn-helix transcriptional regulator [Mesorhizobium sp. LNJC384A00]ESY35304.1 hypothetical protein X747_28815 [Mesorhizobium sp. LNJC384A00]
MVDRNGFIQFLDSLAPNAEMTVSQLADRLEVNRNTVAGWMSSEADYKPSRYSSRNQKHYAINEIKKLTFFVYAMRHVENIVLRAEHTLRKMEEKGISAVEDAFRMSDANFIQAVSA